MTNHPHVIDPFIRMLVTAGLLLSVAGFTWPTADVAPHSSPSQVSHDDIATPPLAAALRSIPTTRLTGLDRNHAGLTQSAAAWSAPVNLSNTATDSGQPSIAADAAGLVHVAWAETGANGKRDIYYTLWDGAGSPAAVNVSNSAPFDSTDPQVVVDSTGAAHLIWQEEDDDHSDDFEALYSKCSGLTCTTPIILSSSRNFNCSPYPLGDPKAAWPTIGIDSADNLMAVWVAFEPGNNYLHYSIWPASGLPPTLYTGCAAQTGGLWSRPRIAGSASNTFHLFWENNLGQPPFGLYYRRYSSGWSPQTIIDSEGRAPNAFATDSDQVHLVWRGSDGSLRYSTRQGLGSWAATETVPGAASDARPGIIVDGNGASRVVWHSSGQVYESVRLSDDWSSAANVSQSQATAQQPDLTADPGGDVYLVWRDMRTGNGEVFFAKQCPKSVCLEVTDSRGNPVRALALNEEGWPMLNASTTITTSANPLTVTVRLRHLTGAVEAGRLDFSILSNSGGRFYVYAAERGSQSNFCGDTPSSGFSTSVHQASCNDSLAPGEAVEHRWHVWVQPSDAATLEFTSVWTAGPRESSDTTTVQVPLAQIHPVVFLHGILGSMPPHNAIISSWSDLDPNKARLDPFLSSYDPLLANLQKMGYVLNETLFPVTYDWRHSNVLSACWLAEVLETKVPHSGEIIAPDGEADVIVHSMGGVVLRTYLEDLAQQDIGEASTYGRVIAGTDCPYGNQNDYVRKAIFIATPHRGFPVTYNTREGLTWKDYLESEVPDGSDGLHGGGAGGATLESLMDEILWPFLIIKHYDPVIFDSCRNILILPELGRLIGDAPFCPPEVLYQFSHSTQAYFGRIRGINSLTEMLPDVSVSGSYLVSAAGELHPYGYAINPLLDGFSSLNDPDRISTLLSRVPASNLYVLYNNDQPTVQAYTVDPPPPANDPYWYIHGGDLWYAPSVSRWPNGFPDHPAQTIYGDGDNLIPDYSTRLDNGGAGLIPLPDRGNQELQIQGWGHKLIMVAPETQSAVAAILTQYTNPISATTSSPFPILTPYTGPRFFWDNLGSILAFLIHSPVDALVTDPLGRRIGYDPVTGQIANEIPGALYSGNDTDMEFILIPGDREGNYTITTTGTGNGPYSVTAYRVGAAGVEFLGGTSDTTVPGQVATAIVTYAPVVDDVFFDDEAANGPWQAEGGWGATADDGDTAPPAWASDATTAPVPGRPITLTLTVPLYLTNARQARLIFNSRQSLSPGALAGVEVSTNGGGTWLAIGLQMTGDLTWERRALDLTPFTQPGSAPIRLRFRMLPAAPTDRWLVDDIRVEGIQPRSVFGVPFEDDFEGWRHWEANGWAWSEVDSHSPTHAWLSLAPDATLTLAGTFTLTNVTHAQLTFWQRLTPNAAGAVEVSTDGGQTWTEVFATLPYVDGAWTQATVDLGAYANTGLSLRFRDTGDNEWAIDDVALRNALPAVIHSLPFSDDMESPEAKWLGLNGFVTTTVNSHSGQFSWRGDTPESALKLIGQFDLSGSTTPILTFWHQFDAPAGSTGLVVVSADDELSWTPVYTQTDSVTAWTPVTVDLSAYVGHRVSMAFYLRDVGGGEAARNTDATILTYALQPSRTPDYPGLPAFSSLALLGLVGWVSLRQRGRGLLGGLLRVGVVAFLLICGYMSVYLIVIGATVRVGPGPGYDYNRLDVVKGQVELVVPAEEQTLLAKVSPDGRWMWLSAWNGQARLIDLERNLQYDLGNKYRNACWLDDEHLVTFTEMLRVSDMARWSLHWLDGYYEDSHSLRELSGAPHIYAIECLTSGYDLMTTDPAYPYVLSTRGPIDAVETKLANVPHTILTRDLFSYGWRIPAYSPDGRYYIKTAPPDPTPPGPKDSLARGPYAAMFDAVTDQRVAHAYKWVWNTIFLGWAYDSSGAYFLYRPTSPAGEMLYQQWPIYKVLVPGAQPRGAPAPATFTPPPTFTPVVPTATPLGWTGSLRLAAFQSQSGAPGWYIDDVSVAEANPAAPRDFYLHGTGPNSNPPTLFLDSIAPSATTPKFKDSPSLSRNGGNPWKQVGVWTADPSLTGRTLTTLTNLDVWLGLKNSDDIGTRFDVRAEVRKNGALVASDETYCIEGLTRNPNSAKEVTVAFGSFAPVNFNGTTDVLSLTVLTRIGTDGVGGACSGHSNAVGLRLYFDAPSRASRLETQFGP